MPFFRVSPGRLFGITDEIDIDIDIDINIDLDLDIEKSLHFDDGK